MVFKFDFDGILSIEVVMLCIDLFDDCLGITGKDGMGLGRDVRLII